MPSLIIRISVFLNQTSPTKNPTTSPTESPSMSPSAGLPEDGVLVGSIFDPDSQVDAFGCNSAKPERAVDNDINNFWW